jgi:hypothetical protein
METKKVLSFIRTRASGRGNAQLEYLTSGKKPDADIVNEIVELQNPDGGFPCCRKKGNPNAVNDTAVVFWWLHELGVHASPCIDQLCNYLIQTQNENGSWDENPSLSQFGLPPWIKPRDLKTILPYGKYCLSLCHE